MQLEWSRQLLAKYVFLKKYNIYIFGCAELLLLLGLFSSCSA